MRILSRRILRLWRNLRGYWQLGQGAWHNLRRFTRNRRVYEPTVEIGNHAVPVYIHAPYCELLVGVRIPAPFSVTISGATHEQQRGLTCIRKQMDSPPFPLPPLRRGVVEVTDSGECRRLVVRMTETPHD